LKKEIKVSDNEIEAQHEFMQKMKEINYGKIKKYCVLTFGCQMNENDSQKLEGMLCEMGYSNESNPLNCDFVIFNTCCVRENAEEKFFGSIGTLKKLRAENPSAVIAACGCMIQQPHIVEKIHKSYRHMNLLFGTHNLYRLPELLYNVITTKKRITEVVETDGNVFENLPIRRNDSVKSWVSIMFGCNNYCTYCIVPYVRGRERSRDSENIISEVSKLAQEGTKEITLLGQNVNSYGLDRESEISFSQLLEKLDKIPGIERIRFMTSHPKDLSDELIEAIKQCKKVCNHLHLPLQSGSTEILKKMNRKYTKTDYLSLVEKVRSQIPDIALTTDIIVGFPGETEEDFEETLDVLKKARFDMAFTFLYSKRVDTPAAKMENQIDDKIKKERFNRLVTLQNTISREINEDLHGRYLDVLVDGKSKNNVDKLNGRTESFKTVNFSGSEELIGKIVKVEITDIKTWSLEGIIRG
jgi:tRNA-2-methylthio-N6-dimethylallyladenosine synthase